MFYLTPQERRVLIWFICVCLVGAIIHLGMMAHAKPLRWARVSSQKIKRTPPDINRANVKQLDRIDGIGPTIAQRIVAYRARHGAFLSLDDLSKVKGISKRSLLKIKAYYAEALHGK